MKRDVTRELEIVDIVLHLMACAATVVFYALGDIPRATFWFVGAVWIKTRFQR